MTDTKKNEKKGSKNKLLVSGNEAVARGLIESGIGFASMYPGTPVTEIGDYLYNHAKSKLSVNYIFDYAINEIVAIEEAIGASWTGIRSAVIFKHLGMNIASDALHSIMYSGIGGKDGAGMLIICGGDPQSSSSTNLMDVRMYSLHSKLPILFPSTVRELHEFTKLGFELSEAIDLPVMIYTTPKLNFATGVIYPGSVQNIKVKPLSINRKDGLIPEFNRDINRYINAIHFAIDNQKRLTEKIAKIENYAPNISSNNKNLDILVKKILKFGENQNSSENKTINKKISKKYTEYAIITGGQPYLPVVELLNYSQKNIPILKINMVYPINLNLILEFVNENNPKQLVVIEELEPLIENSVKIILFDNNILIPVLGKKIFPRHGELTPQIIISALENASIVDINLTYRDFNTEYNQFKQTIPRREPTFCPGCSHRNVFYSLRKTADKLKKKNIDVIFGGDIGCYTMGMSPPYLAMDWLISMGAGIGIANGIGRIYKKYNNKNQRIVALIGDSTFFHSGIQGLLNILKENLNITFVILNNYYSSMTGHQPTFTSKVKENSEDPNIGFQNKQLKLDEFIKNLGSDNITVLSGYDIPDMIRIFDKIIGKDIIPDKNSQRNTEIIVVNSECALMVKRRAKLIWDLPRPDCGPEFYLQISAACIQCNECYARLGCTAIKYIEDEYNEIQYIIDETSCLRENCAACLDVCEFDCIEKILINPNLKMADNQSEGGCEDQ